MRALGAPRAHVLHARALRRHAALPPSSRPISDPCSPAEPRHALALSPVHSKLPLAPCSAALAARRRRQQIPPRTAPPKPPAHASCPRAQAVLILPLVGTRSSPPRYPATTGKWSPAILSSAAAEPASSRYKREPRAPPSTQATSDTPRRTSRVVNRPVVAGHCSGDERGPTSGRIRTACALRQLARAGGLGGAVRGGIRCRRQRAAKAALQGARASLEGTGERASAWRGSAGGQGSEMGCDEGGSAACRRSARACKTGALGVPRARTAPARRNASAL